MSEGKRVGFLGLGAMGRPMAEQILKKGIELHVYDPLEAACRPFAERNIPVARTPAEVASASDVVICMLPHPTVLREALLGKDGVIEQARPGTIVIDMSTDGPTPVIECAKELKTRGVEMIDAPVGKGVWAAETGDLTILMGGDRETCRRVEWVLRLVGSELLYCGPLGSGQVIKIANNIVSCTNIATIVEAYNVAKKLGADLDVLTHVMGSTAADSFQLKHTFAKARKGDFSLGFKTKLALKDLYIARDVEREMNLRGAITEGAIQWYEDAMAGGYGEIDQGALILTLDKPAPTLQEARA
jgi:2-hydroxymethylglutarate dehydrogenase